MDTFYYESEMAAEAVVKGKAFDFTKLLDSGDMFEGFVLMLRNYRECGHFHFGSFARAEWGTKWNATESDVFVGDDINSMAKFDTAWSNPTEYLVKLSKLFPDAEIHVRYADEDLGHNAGIYTLKDGVQIQGEFAYEDESEEGLEKWQKFAAEVKYGDSAEEILEDLNSES